MSAANSVLSNDTSITLDWADVSGANRYHLQVAVVPDFSGTLTVDDNTLVVSTKTFTDGGANDTKRWWRWRYSTDAGTTWSTWSEVGSYWLNTGASADVTLSSGSWAIFDPDAVSDLFTLDDYPVYSVLPEIIYRAKTRNRLGELLSEYVTTKDMISLDFSDTVFVVHRQMREFRRFNTEVKTFFLATYKTNGVDNVPNIWKVQFTEDPDWAMLDAGREDHFIGT